MGGKKELKWQVVVVVVECTGLVVIVIADVIVRHEKIIMELPKKGHSH